MSRWKTINLFSSSPFYDYLGGDLCDCSVHTYTGRVFPQFSQSLYAKKKRRKERKKRKGLKERRPPSAPKPRGVWPKESPPNNSKKERKKAILFIEFDHRPHVGRQRQPQTNHLNEWMNEWYFSQVDLNNRKLPSSWLLTLVGPYLSAIGLFIWPHLSRPPARRRTHNRGRRLCKHNTPPFDFCVCVCVCVWPEDFGHEKARRTVYHHLDTRRWRRRRRQLLSLLRVSVYSQSFETFLCLPAAHCVWAMKHALSRENGEKSGRSAQERRRRRRRWRRWRCKISPVVLHRPVHRSAVFIHSELRTAAGGGGGGGEAVYVSSSLTGKSKPLSGPRLIVVPCIGFNKIWRPFYSSSSSSSSSSLESRGATTTWSLFFLIEKRTRRLSLHR